MKNKIMFLKDLEINNLRKFGAVTFSFDKIKKNSIVELWSKLLTQLKGKKTGQMRRLLFSKSLNIVLSLAIFSLSSCTIEGEEICGIWNVNYGKMQVEIMPWKGKFLGYLLEYSDGNETIEGNKTEDFIFITDLEFKDNKYQNGKIYLDLHSKAHCGLTLELSSENQIKVIYDCEGQNVEENWFRKETVIPTEIVQTSVVVPAETLPKGIIPKKKVSQKVRLVAAKSDEPRTKITLATKINNITPPQIEDETKKQPTFYIIGIQEVVKYDDFKAMEKSIEVLWAKVYEDDFSSKLKNIIEPSNMYVSYSNFDKPKGNMTITLGYKVNDLSNIPFDLKGVKIPSNEYLVYQISGDKSDFEGEGWKQLSELMMYRNTDSADFEVYTFDNSYHVKKAEMWIARK